MEAVVSFWLLVLLMKLKSVILTTNFHLIRVNTRNSTVQTSKSSSALLQVITHMKQFFKLFKGFTEVSSKPETVDALKQNTESASEELSSAIHFSKIRVFSGLSLKSSIFFHIKGHLSILDVLDAEKRLEGWKLKKTYFRETVNKETRKCLFHSKTLSFEIMRSALVSMPQAANFEASFGTLTTLDFLVCFLPSNTKRREISWFCFEIEVLFELKSPQTFKR